MQNEPRVAHNLNKSGGELNYIGQGSGCGGVLTKFWRKIVLILKSKPLPVCNLQTLPSCKYGADGERRGEIKIHSKLMHNE